MSEDIDPSKYSDSKWTRALKKRDSEIDRLTAEIERLKEENAMMTEHAVKFRDMVVEKRQIITNLTEDLNEASDRNISYRKLITELADALQALSRGEDAESNLTDLDQRAREETKK